MTRFARAKGSKASNERKEEEATPWHIMKQQFMDLHNTSTLSSSHNDTSELKNLLQRDTTSVKEIWSDFGDVNGNKVKTIPKKKVIHNHNNYPVESEDNKRFKINDSQNPLHNAESLKNLSKKSRSKSLKNLSCDISLGLLTNNVKETGPTVKCSKTILKKKLKDDIVKLKEHNNIGKDEISNGTVLNLPGPITNLKAKSNKNRKINKIEPDLVSINLGLSAANVDSIPKKKNNETNKVKEKSRPTANHILNDGSQKKRVHTSSDTGNGSLNSNRPIKKSKSKTNVKLKPGNCLAVEVAQNKHLKEAGNFCDNEDEPTPSTLKEYGSKHVRVNSRNASFLKNEKIKSSNYNDWKNFNNLHTIIANGREIKVVNFEGFLIKRDDAIELKRLRKKLRAQNVPKDKINALLKLERRKAEKSLAREKKSVCFHCRKFGHNFTDCPDIKDSDLSKSGMCFKCGSMEHSHYDCKVLQSESFRYAVCFVCKEQGHIARQCKMNPHGQYPKGGSCHFCGEITHLRKDCPKAETDKPSNVLTVEKLSHNLIEDINTAEMSKTVKKRKTKLVTF